MVSNNNYFYTYNDYLVPNPLNLLFHRRALRFWNAAFLDSVHSENHSPTLPRYDVQSYDHSYDIVSSY